MVACSKPLARRKWLSGALGIGTVLSDQQSSRALTADSKKVSPKLDGYDPKNALQSASAGREFFPTLTPPFTNRATYCYDLGRETWALEQLLAFKNVTATIRTIVVKLDDQSLWVNSPQWPTGEFCQLIDALGDVGHVVLPATALEHKAPMAAFLKRYPKASVWVAPGQYGPFGSCGMDVASAKMGYRVDGVLSVNPPDSARSDNNPISLPPWSSEFDYRTLYIDLPENAGPVSEVAFYHRASKSLITTDSVVFIPPESPDIFSTYFRKDEVADPDFWAKSVLQTVFLPLRSKSREDNQPGSQWPGFDSIQGRLLRAPILRALADSRAPDEVRQWVKDVTDMGPFDRILTAHFASPIKATPADFAAAFTYLDSFDEKPIACEDWGLLDSINAVIEGNNLGAPLRFDFKKSCGTKSSVA